MRYDNELKLKPKLAHLKLVSLIEKKICPILGP